MQSPIRTRGLQSPHSPRLRRTGADPPLPRLRRTSCEVNLFLIGTSQRTRFLRKVGGRSQDFLCDNLPTLSSAVAASLRDARDASHSEAATVPARTTAANCRSLASRAQRRRRLPVSQSMKELDQNHRRNCSSGKPRSVVVSLVTRNRYRQCLGRCSWILFLLAAAICRGVSFER